jgi:hypothetical protein
LSPPGGGEARRIFITIHPSAQSSFSRRSGITHNKSLEITLITRPEHRKQEQFYTKIADHNPTDYYETSNLQLWYHKTRFLLTRTIARIKSAVSLGMISDAHIGIV